jgi:hypothetical protein
VVRSRRCLRLHASVRRGEPSGRRLRSSRRRRALTHRRGAATDCEADTPDATTRTARSLTATITAGRRPSATDDGHTPSAHSHHRTLSPTRRIAVWARVTRSRPPRKRQLDSPHRRCVPASAVAANTATLARPSASPTAHRAPPTLANRRAHSHPPGDNGHRTFSHCHHRGEHRHRVSRRSARKSGHHTRAFVPDFVRCSAPRSTPNPRNCRRHCDGREQCTDWIDGGRGVIHDCQRAAEYYLAQ